jgi:hypothetical protein
MRGRSWVLSLCIVGAAVAGTTTWYARYAYDPTDGPIDGAENGLAYAQPIDVGRAMSVGITSLFNDGKEPAVVERVRLLGVSGGLELVGVGTRLFPQGDVGTFAGDFGFPPERYPTKPLAEQNVLPVATLFNETTGEPNDGLQLVIGVRATKPGISAYRAVEVDYRVGRRHYRELFPHNYVHLCAPLSEYVDFTAEVGSRKLQDCPPRELEDTFEDRVLEWPPPASKDASDR